jgi:hypothetical protein
MQMISLINREKHQSKRSFFHWVSLFLLVAIIASCNTSTDKKDNDKNVSDSPVAATPPGADAALADIESKLDVLYMDKAQFEKLWPQTGGVTKKWILKYVLASNKLTFTVWPETAGKFTSETVNLSNLSDSKVEVTNGVIFGDQKLTKKQVSDIKAALPATDNYFIFFVPVKTTRAYEGKNYDVIVYEVRLFDTIANFQKQFDEQSFSAAPITSSNPSPPADAME